MQRPQRQQENDQQQPESPVKTQLEGLCQSRGRISLAVTVTEELYAKGAQVHAQGATYLAGKIKNARALGNQPRR